MSTTDKFELHYRQQLSALVDGELSADESRFLLRRLAHDEELAGCHERWQLCGDVLRGAASAPAPLDFAARVRGAIAEEPAPQAQPAARPGARWRWGGGAAIAASVAAIAMFLARERSPDTAAPGVETTPSMPQLPSFRLPRKRRSCLRHRRRRPHRLRERRMRWPRLLQPCLPLRWHLLGAARQRATSKSHAVRLRVSSRRRAAWSLRQPRHPRAPHLRLRRRRPTRSRIRIPRCRHACGRARPCPGLAKARSMPVSARASPARRSIRSNPRHRQ